MTTAVHKQPAFLHRLCWFVFGLVCAFAPMNGSGIVREVGGRGPDLCMAISVSRCFERGIDEGSLEKVGQFLRDEFDYGDPETDAEFYSTVWGRQGERVLSVCSPQPIDGAYWRLRESLIHWGSCGIAVTRRFIFLTPVDGEYLTQPGVDTILVEAQHGGIISRTLRDELQWEHPLADANPQTEARVFAVDSVHCSRTNDRWSCHFSHDFYGETVLDHQAIQQFAEAVADSVRFVSDAAESLDIRGIKCTTGRGVEPLCGLELPAP